MVLSIDFDYIMAPCIQEYNNVINVSQIERIQTFKQFPNVKFTYDEDKLKWLNSLVDQLDPGRTKCYIINDHSELVTALTNEYNLNNYAPPYEIVNIDHHHDLGYRFAFGECNCANWAQYLINIGILNKYIWIRNNNSDMVMPEEHTICNSIIIEPLLQEEFEFNPKDYDIFILCISYPWIPPQFDNQILGMMNRVCNHWGGG